MKIEYKIKMCREREKDGKVRTEGRKGTQVSLGPVEEMSIQSQVQADEVQVGEMGHICPQEAQAALGESFQDGCGAKAGQWAVDFSNCPPNQGLMCWLSLRVWLVT